MNILVIEDDPVTGHLISELLGQRGHEPTLVRSAEDALALQSTQHFPFLVLDCWLPGMDGYELCRVLRRLPDGDSMTVLMVTSGDDPAAALDAGASDYLRKPLEADLFHTRVMILERQVVNQARRRIAEAALVESQQKYRAIVDAMPDLLFRVRLSGEILDVQARREEDALVSSPASLLGGHLSDVFSTEVSMALIDALAALAPGQAPRQLEFTHEVGDELRSVEARMTRAGPQDALLILRDVTEARRAGEALREKQQRLDLALSAATQEIAVRAAVEKELFESKELFRQMAETVDQCFWVVDPASGRFIYVSPAFREIFGESPDLFQHDPEAYRRFIEPSDQERFESGVRGSFAGEFDEAIRLVGSDRRWIRLRAFAIRDDAERVYRVVGVTEDITDQKRAAESLRASEARNRAILAAAGDGIVTTDEAGAIESFNPAAEAIFGLVAQAVIGTRVSALVPEFFSAAARDSEHVGAREVSGQRQDGTVIPLDLSVSPIALEDRRLYTGIIRDLTERKKQEARLLLADRMASVGTLAAGVAHEVNNPLAYVLSNITYLLDAVRANNIPSREDLDEILSETRQGAERVRNIVTDLRSFSRADDGHSQALNVHAILDSTIKLASAEIRHRATLVRDYRPVPLVLGNDGRLNQVFLNLLVNAVHAVPEQSAGTNTIHISTRTDERGYVVVEVRDNGVGIPLAIQKRIFDPFFTTKPVGMGTGLGLTICHNLIGAMDGELTVESTVGEGSLFRVSLPPATAAAAVATPPPEEIRTQVSGEAKVLVIDDETSVAKALARALKPHCVETARSGREGLDLLRNKHYDIVFCDLIMPDLSGMEIYEQLMLDGTGVEQAIVFMTGGAYTTRASRFLEEVPNRRVEKPFDLTEIRQLVARSIPTSPPAA